MERDSSYIHIPVLTTEILNSFSPVSGQFFVDCTAGGGGHSIAIAKMVAPGGNVLSLDVDLEELEVFQQNVKNAGLENIIKAVHGNFRNIEKIVVESGFGKPKGILFDLGFSSWQLNESGRGFTFQKKEFLDMRFDPSDETRPTAAEIIKSASEKHLAWIFKNYGEERSAAKIANAIVKIRRKESIETTGDLVNIIFSISSSRGRIHPATRVFQALRIAVNNELENIEIGLIGARKACATGGKIAVISFHSLEDRLTKQTFRKWQDMGAGNSVSKKVIRASWQEIKSNPRSRSAKLRIFQMN